MARQVRSGLVYAVVIPGADGFASKLRPDGSFLVYSSYLGGARTDLANAIAIDSIGNVWVAGSTISPDFVVAHPLQSAFGGTSGAYRSRDAFVFEVAENHATTTNSLSA